MILTRSIELRANPKQAHSLCLYRPIRKAKITHPESEGV
jgi:hypothetical protein